MTSRIGQWTLDVQDVTTMAAFWSAALGYQAEAGSDGSAKLYPPDGAGPEALTVWLQASAGPKNGKNRNHPDLYAGPEVYPAEVDRLIALGARHADVGQGEDNPFVVLMDPEDNEFCVLDGDPRRS